MRAEGDALGVFETDEHAATITFGEADFSTLFLTAGTGVHRIRTAVRGMAPGGT
jgi:gluconolactonase